MWPARDSWAGWQMRVYWRLAGEKEQSYTAGAGFISQPGIRAVINYTGKAIQYTELHTDTVVSPSYWYRRLQVCGPSGVYLHVLRFPLFGVLYRGATTFSKLGVQFLGLRYCTEQNTDGIPIFVDCSLLRNCNHTLRQKSWGGPSKFWGSGPPWPPSGCALGFICIG